MKSHLDIIWDLTHINAEHATLGQGSLATYDMIAKPFTRRKSENWNAPLTAPTGWLGAYDMNDSNCMYQQELWRWFASGEEREYVQSRTAR